VGTRVKKPTRQKGLMLVRANENLTKPHTDKNKNCRLPQLLETTMLEFKKIFITEIVSHILKHPFFFLQESLSHKKFSSLDS
jgi:hypothetical protein